MRTSLSKVTVLATSLVLFAGCMTGSGKIYTSDSRYPARPKDAPIEIVDLLKETRSYEVLGIVGCGGLAIPEDPIPLLKKEARKIGADAISTPELKSGDGNVNMQAKALKWK